MKIVFYAPTFRDDYSLECYNLDTKEILSCLSQKFASEWVLMIRMHPNLSSYKSLFDFDGEKIIDVNQYDDMQELLLVSDILITDYSTSMFDFSIMNKPVFLFATDIEQYQKRNEGGAV